MVAVTFLVGTAWSILAPRVGLDPITDDEAKGLGGALAAVLKKYFPSYGEYQPEVNLVLILGGLIVTKYRGKPKGDGGEAPAPNDAADLEINRGAPVAQAEIAARFGR